MADQDFSLLFSLKSDSGAPAAKPDATPAAASQDDFSLLLSLKDSPQAAGGSGMENFVREYKPLADRVAKKLGVAPEAVLGQWGLETGWGKSVIPGTNNLGNIKDFSGAGPKATDNMTGSRDAYRAYGSVEQFGDNFADLVGRRYKSAIGSGNDVGRYFTALKAGGYAEDPDYVSKGVAAARLAASALGQAAPQTSRRDPYTNIRPAQQESRGVVDAVKDNALGLGAGIVQGVGMVAGAFGADNPVATGARDISQGMVDMQSDARKQQRQQRAEAIRSAEESGSTWDEIVANVGAFTEAPLETALNAIGTSAPTLLMAFIPGIGQANAARLIMQGAMGAAQGAGSVKGSIYEAVERKVAEKLIADGVPPEQAKSDAAKVAAGAQAYDGQNKGDIAVGTIFGILAGGTGMEASVGRMMSRGVAQEGAEAAARGIVKRAALGVAKEAPMEGLQGGQERYAANAALQREGFDVPTWQGVAGQAAGEAAASVIPGGVFGAMEPSRPSPQPLPPELQPVAEKAQQPNSPLSRAAMAGNTPEVVAQRQAERAAQAGALDDVSAAETAPAQAKDPGARLAELEAIAKGAPSQQVTDDAGNPLTIPGESGRFFTQEEKAEYDQLVAMKKATEEVRNADQPQVDEISARVDEISQSIRDNDTLQQMRESGEDVKGLLKDLAIAKSKSTRQDQREQAIARVEFALGWADQPTTAQAPTRQQADPILAALNDPAIEAQDREELSIAYQASKNPALPERTRQAALDRAREIVGRYAAPVATQPAQESTPAVLGDIPPQPGTPEEALRNAGQREAGAYQFKAEGYQDEAQALRQEADSLREEAAARREQIEADTRVEQVAAPEVATPRGPGPAAIRKRKATLRQLVDNGLNRVDRRDDGFYLVSQNGRQEFKLDGMADAQLARAAVTESIRDGAALANTAPTEAQIAAGNYKTGVIKFDGIDLAVENPQGSTRSGTDPNGERWETVMPANYGYVRSVKSAGSDKRLSKASVAVSEEFGGAVNAAAGGKRSVDLAPVVVDLISAVDELNSAILENGSNGSLANPEGLGDSRSIQAARSELDSLVKIPPELSEGALSGWLAIDARIFGGAALARAVRRNGFESLPLEMQKVVHLNVLRAIHDPKILRAVVQLVPVDVMNMLSGGKFSSDASLSNESVLLDGFPESLDESVAVRVGGVVDAIASNLPVAFATRAAEKVFASGDSSVISLKSLAAEVARYARHKSPFKEHKGDSKGADGDKLDIYIPDSARPGSPAFIIDQYNDDGTFDETKTVLGVRTAEEAAQIYDAGYSDGSGPRRRGAITEMSIDDFKAWAMSPAAKKPAGAPRAAPADIIQAAQREGLEIDGTMQVTVNGKPVEIGFVKELGKTESVSRGGRARRTSKKQGQILNAIAGAFGKKIKFFYETGSDVGDGFIMPNDPSTIYLNESSSLSPIVVFGHELMHQLKRDNPEAHAAVEAVVTKRMKTKKVQDAYGKLGYQNGQILEELVSDLGGDLMADSTFWSDVFDEVHANNDASAARKIIAKLAEFITRAINALSQNLRSYANTGAGSALVTDMDAIRAAFKDALAGYIQAQGISKPAMQAEILRAGQEAKRSAARADQAQAAIKSGVTETPEFKAWFGDSRVVDAKGSPLRVFRGEHGATKDGDLQTKLGTYTFIADSNIASEYAQDPNDDADTAEQPRVIPAYLRIENPVIENLDDPFVDLSDLIEKFGLDEAKKIAARTAERGIENTGNWMEDEAGLYKGLDSVKQLVREKPELLSTLYMDAYVLLDDKDFVSLAKSKGYDGAIHIGNGISGSDVEYRVFSKEQIKSAIGNNGEFNPGSQDITRSVGRSGSEIIRLGSGGDSGAVSFLASLNQATTENPMNERVRVLDDLAVIEASKTGRRVHVSEIRSLRPGGGRRALALLVDLADKHGVTLELFPSPIGASRMSESDLRDWYGRHGFESDDTEDGEMVRYPRDRQDITRSADRSDALTVEAYHFSQQPRSVLTTGAFGTGLQGSDREAIMAHPDQRLRQRLSFYVNKGSGVRPESGVGGIAHKAALSNIYDGDADVKRLKQGRDRRGFESAVLDAGYSGYLTRLEGTQPGQVILLGRQTVTPEVLGPRTNIPEAKPVPQPAARDMDIGDRINANKMLPAGRMEPADWKKYLQRLMPAEAAELDGTDVFDGSKAIYKDELVARIRNAAAPIASRARQIDTPEFRRWFADSKVVDADGNPLVVYHGTRSDVSEFDRGTIGSATDDGFLGDGFYFTDSPRAASAFAKGDGGNVVAAYVSIKNPYYADGLLPDHMTAESLQASGFDGVIYQADGSGDYSEFVAFSPNQIKSAIGNNGAFDPADSGITRSADRSVREAKIEKLAPVAQRGERIVGQRVTLTADEKQAIEFSAETTGVSAKEITRVVREHKLAHPPAQGWAPLVFTKAKTEKGKLVYEYEKVPYSFNADKDGRALKQDTPEYSRRVGAVARRMADEVRRVYQRSTAGDKNAENILAQAGWYKSMRARLRHEFGGLGDLFADLLGATSPNTPVRDNWSNAVDSLRRATRGDFDELIPAWEAWADAVDERETELRAWFNEQQAAGKSKKAIKDSAEYKQKLDAMVAARELPEALLPTKETGKKYGFNGRNVARAMVDLWRVVRDADPDVKRGGTAPKAVNFSGNLIGFRERATIDVWAARMLQRMSGGLRVPSMAEDGVSGLMRADGSTTLQFGFGQDVFSDAVKRIRKDPELKTNDTLAKINDDDLQAVVWFVEKEIWTANNWTSAAGEGGSFELEASLSGSAQQQRIRELRRVIDSSLSKPAAKAEARAELAKLERTVDRFVGGLSIQMSADTQGIDFVPQDSDMARLSNEISTSIYEDESATAVLASKALSTEGRYGGIERSMDLEVVAREGYRPGALWKKMLETARDAKQDSTFLSRVLRDEEKVDLLRHRPGVEIYFREAASREKLESVLGELAKEGVEFLTVIVDGRRMTDATRGQMPPAVGVRMQYVPEFEQRYGMDDLNGLDDAALAAKIQEKADEMSAMAERVAKSVGDVSFASQFWYETNVAFSHEYQEKIDAIATGTAQGAAQEVGGQEWSGQSVRAGLESANRQAREAAGSEPDGDVLGGDAPSAQEQNERIEALKELIACLGR